MCDEWSCFFFASIWMFVCLFVCACLCMLLHRFQFYCPLKIYHMKSVCKKLFISSNGWDGLGETLTGRLYMQIFWLYFRGTAAIGKLFDRVFPYRRMRSTMSQQPRILTGFPTLYRRMPHCIFIRIKQIFEF